ncbi:MAG TPA: BrnT family toxin [Syntrophobacteraceae bacterium]|nr:BrnT family toxin [Syntrophobacteraceae bacterium]
MKLGFEWDEEKATRNNDKHGVSFEEGVTVFHDPLSISIDDPDHSRNERRYIDIGASEGGRIQVVSYTERAGRIRIISCRKATKIEWRQYEEGIHKGSPERR